VSRVASGARLIIVLTFPLIGGCGSGGSVSSSVSPPQPTAEVLTITTGSNIQCIQTVPFSMSLQVQGASSPVAWKIMSGQLPPGLALDSSSGVISGVPAANSGSPVTIQVADTKASTSAQFFFTVWSKLILNSVSPAPAHRGAPYSLTISGQGVTISSWMISAGQLPPGLALIGNPFNVDFVSVSGTPSQVGTYSFTVQAQSDSPPQTATLNITIAVDSHLALSKSALKNGGQNQPYSDSFSIANGTPPFFWSVTGDFPSGLTVTPSSGAVSGTPTTFGNFLYSVSVTDSSSPAQSDSAQGILNIAEQLRVVGAPPNAIVALVYIQSLTAIGGTSPYNWALTSGVLPPGLSLFSYGSISGVPTQLGVYNFVLQVTDSGSPPYVLTVPTTIQVNPPPLAEFGAPLSPAPLNVLYHSQIPVSGGTPPYTFSISSGKLPPGLALNTASGNVDGTPTQAGTFSFGAKVTDSANPPQVVTANDLIQIRPRLGRNDSIATATPLGNTSPDQSFPLVFSISPYVDPIDAPMPNPDTDFFRLIAAGGSSVHVEVFAHRLWGANPLDSVIELVNASGQRLQSCTLPSYISTCINDDLDTSTPDSGLDFQVPGFATSNNTFYLHVFDWRGDARPDMQYSLKVSGVIDPLTISPATLGVGATRGVAYQQQFSTTGGTGAVTWSLGGGSLPPGWSLNSSGLLSGIATTDGFYTFAIKAVDSGNPPQNTTTQYTVQIAEPVLLTSPTTWPNACLNKLYSFTATTTGGIPPITFTYSAYPWVEIFLDQATGIFSGTGNLLGTFTAGIGAIDSAQPPSSAGQTISLTVVNCP
jgi:large repetitive protein